MRLLMRCCALLLLMIGGAHAAAPKQTIPTGLLPKTAEPLAYSLHFDVDPASTSFHGTAELQVRLTAPADHLWLHGLDLKVKSVKVSTVVAKPSPVSYRQVNAEGVARVDFGHVMAAQDITLSFDYSGSYSADLEGIYKVSRGPDDYLMTQMEAIGARRAFPGFDEPRFKTPFTLSLSFPAQHLGFANTRQTSESVQGDIRTLTFAPTEKLPTYLVAFAVGPWDVTATSSVPASSVRSTAIPLRVIGPKGSAPKLAYALANTPQLVLGLEEYFGIAYPFDKLDLLAGPDFAFGAMENAGLITFVDSLLILDEKSSVGAINAFRSVNTHELAHQWFGNLVTPYWWDDIWLNEAFATWNAAKITAQLFPEAPFAIAQLRDTQGAMNEDSLVSARRIREPIRTTGDIAAAFDGITYEKGAGVLATFENWIGKDAFQRGVHAHMTKHARGTATADDLIGALAAASGKGETFAAAIRTFLDQPGLPLVAVTPQCRDGKASLKLRQSRYLPLGSPGAKPGKLWQVPVCLRLGNGTGSSQRCELLDAKEKTISLEQCPAWVLPNANAGGYYRFTLPPADLKALLGALPTLTAAEQLAVLDAVSAAFALGKADATALLDAAAASAGAPQAQVVSKLWGRFAFLRDEVLDPAGVAALRTRLALIYQPALARLGLAPKAGESEDDTELRAGLVHYLAVDWQVPAVREALLAVAKPLFDRPGERLVLSGISEDLLPAALAVWARAGGASAATRLQQELLQNQDPAQRRAVVNALASIGDPAIASSVRDLTLNPQLQLRDLRALLNTQEQQHVLDDSFWPWYQAHFSTLLKRMPEMAQTGLVEMGTRNRCNSAEVAAFRRFIGSKLPTISNGPRALAQATEGIGLCAALAKHHAGTKITAPANP